MHPTLVSAAGKASRVPWEAPQVGTLRGRTQTSHLFSEVPIPVWEILAVAYLPWRRWPPWSVI